ncbi:MAG TPA: four-carbon acid sugar kinase family protein [Propionibacteriaceae bacterium]|nr:four-carbon acid sugar kinase family protein [Propionibacteriaceae bacterium]
MPVSSADLLAGLPAATEVPATELAGLARQSGRVLVVLDDDPTGTQSVYDLPVVMDWSTDSLAWALRQGAPAVYVMTNSRSLDPEHAERCNREVARAAFAAAERVGVRVDFVSRSDSTLRGHFPLEPATLAEEVAARDGRPVDGIVIVPAFGDAGRITVDSVHYAGNPEDGYTPVGETEFARDATFGYHASDLRKWVEEKTGGRIPAGEVARIDLTTLRTDHDATVARLTALSDARPLVCDAVTENDLRLLALALYTAEARGTRLVYRVGPPFVRAVIGQEVRAPLQPDEIAAIREGGLAERAHGGLIVVGSHVSMTTRQLAELVAADHPVELDLDVATILSGAPGAAERHVDEVARQAAEALATGNVVVRTSRTLVRADDPASSLAIARSVSGALVAVVAEVLAARPPRFVVAKGGITSSDVAARGLGISRAMVRGSLLPGIVSLWEPVDGPARGIPYVVFAGNVGGPHSLADVVHTLST